MAAAALCLAFASCGGFAKLAKDDDDGSSYPPSVVFAWIEKAAGSPHLHVRFNEDVKVDASSGGAQGWSFEGTSNLSFTGAVQGSGTAELVFQLNGNFSHTDNTFEINYLRAFGSVESVTTEQKLEDIYGLKPANSAINPSNPSDFTILRFDSKDGAPSINSTLTVALGTSVGLPVDMHKAEAVFAGWSETDGGEVAVPNPYTPTLGGGGEQTLFAIWQAGVENVPDADAVRYDVIADGLKNTETTTALYLTFASPVKLAAGSITINNGTAGVNSAISLAGSGVQWKVGVTGVTGEGYVNFSINADGVESAVKRVAIHKYAQGGGAVPTNPPKPYQYKVTADGDAGIATSALRFIFESAVSIEAAEVAVENSAVLSKEYLTASNAGTYSAVWDLAASAAQTGETRVKIGNAAVVDEWKTVTVYAGSGGGSTGGNGNGNGGGQDYTIFADGANGTATTTKLYLLFENPVQGLTFGNVTVANDSGAANKNSTLTQSGNLYELPITVSKAGAVQVSIGNVSGVYSGLKAVVVHVNGQSYPNVPGAPGPNPNPWNPGAGGIDYTVSADNPTTHLIFGFDKNIYGAGLTAANITITDDTGHALKTGVFRGAGSLYILDVNEVVTGWVNVTVAYNGIVAAPKRVYVYAGAIVIPKEDIDYSVSAGSGATTPYIEFTFNEALSETLKAGEIEFVTKDIATMGALSGSGAVYRLALTNVQKSGDLTLKVDRKGIVSGTKTVAISKAAATYSVSPVNTNGTTTALTFNFSEAVSLNASDIKLVTTGLITAGSLSGSGTNKLTLTVNALLAGNQELRIEKTGIEAVPKSVIISKIIDYTATPDSGATTAYIDFVFTPALSSALKDSEIQFVTSGIASVGTLSTLSGTSSYRLNVTNVQKSGDLYLKINKSGVTTDQKKVAIKKKADITYIVDGITSSSQTIMLLFQFSESVQVEKSDIKFGTPTLITTSSFSSGSAAYMGVTALKAGTQEVWIDKAGIEAGHKTVEIRMPADYTVTADSSATSAYIDFKFDSAVSDLTADNIVFDTANVANKNGALSSLGNNTYRLPIAALSANNLTLHISKTGIVSTARTVKINKAAATYTAAPVNNAEGTTTALTFKFSESVLLALNDIKFTAPALVSAMSLSGSGANYTLNVTASAAGAQELWIEKSNITNAKQKVTIGKAADYNLSAVNNSEGTTTHIDFNFTPSFSGLTANDITIVNTDTATKVSLSGNRLAINTLKSGTLTVSINKSGVVSGTRTVTIGKAVDYDVSADTAATSTYINFTFKSAVSGLGLTANNIVFSPTDIAAKGDWVTNSGTSYTLKITALKAGSLNVSINKSGIVSGAKSVTINKPTDYNLSAVNNSEGTTTHIDFNFTPSFSGLTANDITIVNTDTATKVSLSGNRLAINTLKSGTLTVSINKSGVVSATRTVTIGKAVDYDVSADSSATSTYINFTFKSSVSGLGLTASNINFSPTDIATKGDWVTNSGTSYTLKITAQKAGNLNVSINKSGIVSGAKSVTIKKVSSAGENWTDIPRIFAQYDVFYAEIRSIAYGKDKFVVVGKSTNEGIYPNSVYSTNGKDWKQVDVSVFKGMTVYSITYGNGKFIAGGSKGGTIAYSADGINWTAASDSKFGNYIVRGIVYGKDKFVAVGTGGKMSYSADGITWTAVDSKIGDDDIINSISYGDDKFVAVTHKGKVSYSSDGINWNAPNTSGLNYLCSITYGNGKFVAVGTGGGIYSTNGVNWIKVSAAGYGITYGDSKFIVVDQKGGIFCSLDGINWNNVRKQISTNAALYSVAYGNGTFVAGGMDGRPPFNSSFAYSKE